MIGQLVDPMIGTKAPPFALYGSSKRFSFSEIILRKQWLILYFYPKDDTSGCTIEAKEFSKLAESFGVLNARVIGISPDPEEAHTRFINQHNLKIHLLSDVSKEVIKK